MSKRLLIVDDERDLSELLAYNLHRAGYEVRVAHNGRDAIRSASEFAPNLILLDVMMPEISGTEVARQLKRTEGLSHIPIVMLTARAEEADELDGLATGAEDYITKPFSMKVLEARVEAVLRRSRPAEGSIGAPADAPIAYGPLTLDAGTHEVRLSGRQLKLTNTEFRIIASLLHSQGRVLTRQALINRAMGPGVTVTERTIDVHVTSIRKKLSAHSGMIRTVRGVGYRLVLDQDAESGGGNRPAAEAVDPSRLDGVTGE